MASGKQRSMRRKKAGVTILALFLVVTFVLAMVGPIYCGRDTETTSEPGEEDAGEVVPEQPAAPESSPDTTPIETAQPEATGIEAITGAAVAYARANNPSLPELAVLDVNTEGDWALVRLQPVDKSTDVAGALLNIVNGEWKVIDFGFVLPENHPDAPPGIFN
ncbi:MAG: hypothetical protein KKH73_00975 [Actinobacteria bacterium]|nr:hypothetical protein [Actinomycetota bacterium]MCG2794989.1 hypothetical protein [Actinomycetes bacterium]MCG2817987.1 hypothetical protein [Actinomycetes bacterium]